MDAGEGIDGDKGIWAAKAQKGRLNMVVHREIQIL